MAKQVGVEGGGVLGYVVMRAIETTSMCFLVSLPCPNFYPQSLEVELWVFRLSFYPSPLPSLSSPPHCWITKQLQSRTTGCRHSGRFSKGKLNSWFNVFAYLI